MMEFSSRVSEYFDFFLASFKAEMSYQAQHQAEAQKECREIWALADNEEREHISKLCFICFGRAPIL